ncbi:class I SAM-dependent methyltransferase [Rhabdobacter roseus]|uniref:2-polyprenyl-3-methyl-5-hydroxy-6-metoxy-1, 4-benzoquinol methylase n=1 Tax=Rhabdobacter roseus TaxID=1655419 RepID=A0A840U6Z3_9BACT|nr:class I SAM-dependent methyltransferase [Rhabdobacter roseus]MBB5287589.1 2-polyprenyl-3-methyl-5-hydroxy-6-metoxy-1,4-benzoquinol methylase [Rhabdobacter roseus]
MTLETLSHCPVCTHTQFAKYLLVKDHTVSKRDFQIVRCERCGFLFTNPRPPAQEIGQYYDSSDYISHHDEATTLMSRVYNGVRNYTTGQKIHLIERVSPRRQGTLLDVGCGTGYFLSQCRQQGWTTVGTEPDAQARDVAQSRVGELIFESIEAPYFEEKSFDIITMWHVLEHVHDLNGTLDWLRARLVADGKLLVAVPNPESNDAQTYQANWAAYDVPRHLYHFTRKTMQELMDRHAFRLESVQPMWFDSYYVSMLSTRYQSGRTSLPKSVLSGSVSNWKGRKSSKGFPNTSSLIYVLSKA